MAKEIKNQHYLPFVYLNQFRSDIAIRERGKSTFYFDNGTMFKEVPVDTQGAKKWFYRKENTEESEKSFQKYEKDWNTLIDNQRRGKYEDALAFLQIIMYHFRNTGIELVNSKFPRFESIQNAVYDFTSQKILKLKSDQSIFDDKSYILNFPWECRIVNFNGFKLITSDNPAVLTIRPEENGYGPFFIPISSCELLVAIDKSKYKFNTYKGTNQDSYVSNAYVACQSNSMIFYAKPMKNEHRTDLWKLVNKSRLPNEKKGKFEQEIFIPTHTHYNEQFSFLDKLNNE